MGEGPRERSGDSQSDGNRAQRPPNGALQEAEQRLNQLLAEFRLYGGFAGPEGMRLWGAIQQTVRDLERLRALPEDESQAI